MGTTMKLPEHDHLPTAASPRHGERKETAWRLVEEAGDRAKQASQRLWQTSSRWKLFSLRGEREQRTPLGVQ